MRLERSDASDKGWLIGGWNSDLGISIGYANKGIDEPHIHSKITEIFLVAGGMALIRIGLDTLELTRGDVLVVEPGEEHTFLSSSPDYFHYVIHTPGLTGEQAQNDKKPVSRKSLGL